jgi:hypothetical protein
MATTTTCCKTSMAVEVDIDVRPLGALSVGQAASTTKIEEDIDGEPPQGHCRRVRQHPPPMLKTTSTADPLVALSAGPTVSSTEVEEDIHGSLPGGHCRRVRQHPPLMLKMTSMVGPLGGHYRWARQRPPPRLKKTSVAGPLGGAADRSGSVHHRW